MNRDQYYWVLSESRAQETLSELRNLKKELKTAVMGRRLAILPRIRMLMSYLLKALPDNSHLKEMSDLYAARDDLMDEIDTIKKMGHWTGEKIERCKAAELKLKEMASNRLYTYNDLYPAYKAMAGL